MSSRFITKTNGILTGKKHDIRFKIALTSSSVTAAPPPAIKPIRFTPFANSLTARNTSAHLEHNSII